MTFGQRLKKLRTLKNIAQTDLSMIFDNTTVNTIANWESNQYLPNGRELKKLAQFFDVSVDYLLGLDSLRKSKK